MNHDGTPWGPLPAGCGGSGEQGVCPQAQPETGRAAGRGFTLPAQGVQEAEPPCGYPAEGTSGGQRRGAYTDPNPKWC